MFETVIVLGYILYNWFNRIYSPLRRKRNIVSFRFRMLSVLNNYSELLTLGDQTLDEGIRDTEMKAHIIGVGFSSCVTPTVPPYPNNPLRCPLGL